MCKGVSIYSIGSVPDSGQDIVRWVSFCPGVLFAAHQLERLSVVAGVNATFDAWTNISKAPGATLARLVYER